MNARTTAKSTPTAGHEYMEGVDVYGEAMVSVDDVKNMIEEAFDAGREASPTGQGATGCQFSFRTLYDVLRLADMFGVPEIRPGDTFEFGAMGIQRVES